MQTVEFEKKIKNGQLTIPVELLAQLQPYKETEAVCISPITKKPAMCC
jgi:hypothetical protein